MPRIIFKERTSHLASYIFLQDLLMNIKTLHFHSSINHQDHLFHRTPLTQVFFRGVSKTFNNAFFCRTPLVTASGPQVAASVFFKKSN